MERIRYYNSNQIYNFQNVVERLAIRTDAFVRYKRLYDFEEKKYIIRPCSLKVPLCSGVINFHLDEAINYRIALYVQAKGKELVRWLSWDIDSHGWDDLTDKNFAIAEEIIHNLRNNQLYGLIEKTNNTGGMRVHCLFAEDQNLKDAHFFAKKISEKYPEVETNPKNFTINPFGNAVRLPGPHHKRAFFSEFWDGENWTNDLDFFSNRLVSNKVKIPEYQEPIVEQKQKPNVVFNNCNFYNYNPLRPNWRLFKYINLIDFFKERNELKTINGEKAEIKCPFSANHTTGDTACIWYVRGEKLTFNCFHQHCEGKNIFDVLNHFDRSEINKFLEI